ncbi:unnamed protein product [Rotaria socialis]|uniref:Kinesin-like protein n=1 Tax=Rotaria socialis TaxID=392032 RepID=A0A821A3K6_9BILA|nr:unnamed protein product [Rotaria socialis]CAF4571842.1 unnamed protein product [Rotaria socialis]
MLSNKSESVKVLIRCRPFNQTEIINHSIKCIDIQQLDNKNRQCTIKLISPKRYRRRISRLFRFDSFYDENHPTEHIFQDFIQSLVSDVTLNGYSGTVFAYGQTGSGKSWTMAGCQCQSENGLISIAIENVFNLIHQSNYEHEFTIKCAYLEIYNEELHDLLLPRNSSKLSSRLELRENPRSSGVHITNLTWKNVYSIDECLKFKRFGDLARTMGSTQMNRDSSRSHTMFSLSIQYQNNSETKLFRQGKLNFVDLAGSERQIKTGASGQQLLESAKINLSLSALNKVISSLVQTNTTHIPYRDSKLTRLLQDSIGGTTKTIMIACISPSEDNYDETLCTLRYASRTKNIRNTPIINENSSYVLLQQYAEEIQRLRAIINSSNIHMHSLSRSVGLNETKFDDQHSLKTICDRQISSENSPATMAKCQRSVSCQTMSILTATVISSTQTTYDIHDKDSKQIIILFDENQQSYEFIAWHSCQLSPKSYQKLIILVKENKNENSWLGTLIANTNEKQSLIWKNHLYHRQHQLQLSKQTDSIITHFAIEETIDSRSSSPTLSLILYTSSNYIILNNNIFLSLSYKNLPINNHFITLKEQTGSIYYLSDMLYSLSKNELLVFKLDQNYHYRLHHIILNEKFSLENNEQVDVEHCCCCLNSENEALKTKFISSSHFLSFINMSCEIEEEQEENKTNMHLINVDNNILCFE